MAARTTRSGRRTRRVRTEIPGEVLGRTGRPLSVVDLSPGGCLVCTEQRLAPGAILDLRFDLADGALTAKARVVETSIDGSSLPEQSCRYLAGLQFLDLRAGDERRLLGYLSDSARTSPPPRPGDH